MAAKERHKDQVTKESKNKEKRLWDLGSKQLWDEGTKDLRKVSTHNRLATTTNQMREKERGACR